MADLQIDIIEATIDDSPILRNMLQFYVYDFSEIEGYDLNEHGLYRYRYLDYYWTEEDRSPYLIRVNKKLAGFALVNTHTYAPESDQSIAEFFVMRKYRRTGVGREVVFRTLDSRPGWWEVIQTKNNTIAQHFWRSVLAAYSPASFTDYGEGVGNTDRPVQTVLSRTKA